MKKVFSHCYVILLDQVGRKIGGGVGEYCDRHMSPPCVLIYAHIYYIQNTPKNSTYYDGIQLYSFVFGA